MNPQTIRDLGSTITGGGAGLFLLTTVDWKDISHGQLLKVAVALSLVALGYLMYRRDPEKPA